MINIRIDTQIKGNWTDTIELASTTAEFGFNGTFTPETDEDQFLPLPLIADRTEDVQIGVRIATSFT